MTYSQALEYLYKQLPMYQREGKTAFKKDLKNTEALCAILGQPQNKFKSIHIAGTNGKGSSAHMMSSIFQEAGYKTALYTSPHLKDFRERIKINGEMISEKEVIDFIHNYKDAFESIKPSFFEWTVALAFYIFAEKEVDIAIIETGLGGRLDSTNVILPELCLITNIGMDHTDMLGDTIEAIAKEKAGIIKKNTPVVISEDSGVRAVFTEKATQLNAPIYFAQDAENPTDIKTDLLGMYQKNNIRGVLECCKLLQQTNWSIRNEAIESGLLKVVKNTRLRGRWDVIAQKPYTVLETAHNKEGLRVAIAQLLQHTQASSIHFVLGFVKEKTLEEILNLFPRESHYYFCQARVPRALDLLSLEETAKKFNLQGQTYASVQLAFDAAKAASKPNEAIYVGGSTFVVAEIL